MDNPYICELCQRTYGAQRVRGVRRLSTFNGYTVDLKLREFRKVGAGASLRFLSFSSDAGRALLRRMHDRATA